MVRLYNTLSRTIEEFTPINPPHVRMYTCGPTVYSFAHIGNFRTYTTSDILIRALKQNGYDVEHVMNITDVGHLTGDNLGDADTGEDRMEKSAREQGKSAFDVAKFYTNAFLKDYQRLNLLPPTVLPHATEHIKQQIALVKKLQEKGFTYRTSDGIYFNTAKFPEYGKLSSLDEIKEGARVEKNSEKKNSRDFALWKFSVEYVGKSSSPNSALYGNRQMEWWFDGPFSGELYRIQQWHELDKLTAEKKVSKTERQAARSTIGFPGWHIECSAMSMEYLGETFDIHAGGVDLSSTHHPNEIAQAEAATGKPFVDYWIHTAFILIDGKRMSKSQKNAYTVSDLIDQGFSPLALRYLYLQTHYRSEMNFTWKGMKAAQSALDRLYETAANFPEPAVGCAEFEQDFLEAVNNDLNMPKALSIMWELLRSNYPDSAKAETLYKMDEVLGLGIQRNSKKRSDIPEEILELAKQRETLRKQKKFGQADQIRVKIEKKGYIVKDSKKGPEVLKKI